MGLVYNKMGRNRQTYGGGRVSACGSYAARDGGCAVSTNLSAHGPCYDVGRQETSHPFLLGFASLCCEILTTAGSTSALRMQTLKDAGGDGLVRRWVLIFCQILVNALSGKVVFRFVNGSTGSRKHTHTET